MTGEPLSFNPDEGAFGFPLAEVTEILQTGEIEIEGRMPYSSNVTLLVTIAKDSRTHRAIYKPAQGERPLHDFPENLYKREAAMYQLSEQLGWGVVPPTVVVEGPLGEGSVQALVNADYAQHYFTLLEADIGRQDLERLCVLDLIANNTDRKSGHCLLGSDGRIYGIDHGLSFHAQFKLRTVMWDFVGEPIPQPLLADLERFIADRASEVLSPLLDSFEVDAVLTRAKAVVAAGVFPEDDTGGRRYPWPLV